MKAFIVLVHSKLHDRNVYELLLERLNGDSRNRLFSPDIRLLCDSIIPTDEPVRKTFRLPDGQYLRYHHRIDDVLAEVKVAVQHPAPFDCSIIVIEVPDVDAYVKQWNLNQSPPKF
jgi:hypothetical protein